MSVSSGCVDGELRKGSEKSCQDLAIPSENKEESKEKLRQKIENTVLELLSDIANRKAPSLALRNQKDWNNCYFTTFLELKDVDSALLQEIKYTSKKTNQDFAQIIFILFKSYQLLIQNASSSRREIYYENLDLFEDQSQIDSAAERVSCLLEVPQWELGLLASSKGLVAGDLRIVCSSATIDCSHLGGVVIPADLPVGAKLMSSAKFVLIVEKDSAFQKLSNEGFLDRHGPCIMITGKGYPDVSTRVLVKSIESQLSLPVFILVDSDPYGVEIMCIYKYGSLSQSHLGSRLALPSASWIGVHPTDLLDLALLSKDLTARDLAKLNSLLHRPYIQKEKNIRNQLRCMLKLGKKSEIEGLVQISQGYLTDVYIPMKMTSKELI